MRNWTAIQSHFSEIYLYSVFFAHMGYVTIAVWQDSTNHSIFTNDSTDKTNPWGNHPIFSLVTSNLNSLNSDHLELLVPRPGPSWRIEGDGVTAFIGNNLFLMDNDNIDKDEFFITLSKRTGENLQSTPTKSCRTETCSPASGSKNSNEGESMWNVWWSIWPLFIEK